MIHFTKGDMFDVTVDVRVNTVNCQGVMGAGVALAFRKKYPDMFHDYQKACAVGDVQPGRMHIWKNAKHDWIINFPTKRTWREKSRYDDIASGLRALREYLAAYPGIKVALPALGCGNGGLDWKRVAPMIQESLQELEADIFVFEPADSLNLGRKVVAQSRKTSELELQELGFKYFDLPYALPNQPVLQAQVKGNAELLSIPWIAIYTSQDIGPREFSALVAIAEEMKQYENAPAIAFLYRGNAVEEIADEYLKRGLPVILLLPFSPLAKKRVGLSNDPNNRVTYAILSVSEDEKISAGKLQKLAMEILFSAGRSILIADPDFFQREKNPLKLIGRRSAFFIRYASHSSEMVGELENWGVRSIGRKLETGNPNLLPLISESVTDNIVIDQDEDPSDVGDVKPENIVALLSPYQLREIASILEQASLDRVGILASVAVDLIPENLKNAVRNVLKDSADSGLVQ